MYKYTIFNERLKHRIIIHGDLKQESWLSNTDRITLIKLNSVQLG